MCTSLQIGFLIAMVLSGPSRLDAQLVQPLSAGAEAYRLSTSNEVVMKLSGTTPVKNWEMSAHGLSGDANLIVTDKLYSANANQAQQGVLLAINSLSFTLPVHNLKGEVRAMDEDAYKALKADYHKDITFKLISAKLISATVTDKLYSATQTSTNSNIAARGSLSVAGVTRVVILQMLATIARDGSVTFTGTQILRMSDYNVERPTLLFGAIKAGNEMTLKYKLIFVK